METYLIETWELFSKEFDVNKHYHWFALVNLTRFTIEHESLKRVVDEINYSIMHKYLHVKSVETDKVSFLKSMADNLSVLPEKYNINIIIKKIAKKIPKEEDYFNITNNLNNGNTQYVVKLSSTYIFSYHPLKFVYAGKLKNGKTITFISEEKMDLHEVWKINLIYVEINNTCKMFLLFSSENLSQKFRKEILEKYSLSSAKELFLLLEDKCLPKDFSQIHEREIISDIATYYSNPFSKLDNHKLWFPFFKRPYINSAPGGLPLKYSKKIIDSYKCDNQEYLRSYNFKKCLDKKNTPFIPIGEAPEETPWFFRKDSEKIYYDKYLFEVERFKKLFIKIDSNNIYSKEKEVWSNIVNRLQKQRTILLVGPAGHGKSFELNKVAEFYKKQNMNVKLICPTWKSMEVYKQSIIHSTIAGLKNKEDFFNGVDLLIIDEFSLILEWSFLDDINLKTRIIIAGDPNQLKPIKSKINKVSWLISEANKQIIDLKNTKNHRINEDNNYMKRIQTSILKKSFNHKKSYTGVSYHNSLKDIMNKIEEFIKNGYTIITPINGGLLGVDFLNRYFGSKISSTGDFSEGDKIIFTQTNNNEKYYSGLHGEIIKIEQDNYYVKTHKWDNKLFLNTQEKGLPFSHSIAINAHKAQGATLSKVAVIVYGSVTYDWLYTAYSRASNDAAIIFKQGDFDLRK